MGKVSKRPNRRNRPSGRYHRAVPVNAGGSNLKLVIATSPPSVEGGEFLYHDLELVRSALLYADTIELISPVAVMISSFAALCSAPDDGWLALLADLDDETLIQLNIDRDPNEFREMLLSYRTLAALPRDQRRSLLGKHSAEMQAISKDLRQSLGGTDGARSMLEQMVETAGAPELVEAVDAGILTLNWDFMGTENDTNAQIVEYTAYLRNLLQSSNTHLLLDESMAGLAHSLIKGGGVTPSQLTLNRAARARIGTGLVSHLPVFPYSTVSSVLEARSELDAPLTRYRKGVSRLTERLQSDTFDAGVSSEIQDMWRDEVHPAIDTLRSDLSKTRLVREALQSIATDPKVLGTGGSVLVGVQTLTQLHDYVSAGLGAGGLAQQAVRSALKDSKSRRQDAKQHSFFYLLELEKRL